MTTTTTDDRHSNDTGAGHETHGNGNGYGHSGESQLADCNTQGGNGVTGGNGGNGGSGGEDCQPQGGSGGSGGGGGTPVAHSDPCEPEGGGGGNGGYPVADCEPCDGAYHGSLIAVNVDIDVSINLASDILPCLDLPAICIDADAHAVV